MGDCFWDLIILTSEPELAFELGVVSQLVYKNSCAHRGHKYFQALKKIDRHMHFFTSLHLLQSLKEYRSDPDQQTSNTLQERMLKAQKVLAEAEKNCIETIRSCLPQLAIKRFVSLHTLLVNVVSNIWAFVKALQEKIDTCVKFIGADSQRQDLNGEICSTNGLSTCSKPEDLGTQLDLGVAISRNGIKATMSNTKMTDSIRVEETAAMPHRAEPPSSEHSEVLNFDNAGIKCALHRQTSSDLSLPLRPNLHGRYRNRVLHLKPYHKSFLKHCRHRIHLKMRTKSKRLSLLQ